MAGTSRQCSGILHGNRQVDSEGGKIKRLTSRGSWASTVPARDHPCALKVAEGVEDGSSLLVERLNGRSRKTPSLGYGAREHWQDEILHGTTTMAMHEN